VILLYSNHRLENIMSGPNLAETKHAHNVSGRRRGRMWGIGEFVDYLESLRNMETTYDDSSWSGISISYKRSEK
jgi:hypothetical protein